MRFVWNTAVKDWQRHRRDPVGLLMWIGVPLIIGGLMTAISGGPDGPAPKAHVFVVDNDGSVVSALLKGALNQAGDNSPITSEEVDAETGKRRMDDGEASAMLIIPKGFGEAVLLEEPATLELLTNPSQRILPGIVEEGLSILVDATFYVHRLIGEDLKGFATGAPDNETIGAFSIKINELVQRFQAYLTPAVIQLEKVEEETAKGEDEDGVSIGLLFLPGVLFMSLLFMAQGVGTDFWNERTKKTLRRVIVTPQSTISFMAGKVLGGVGVMFIVCGVAFAIAYPYFGLKVELLPLAIVWSLLSGAFLIVLLTVIQLYATSERAAGILSMAIIFPLMMMGGSFFPFETMPPWMASIGKLTPNGWALAQLKNILFDQLTLRTLGITFVGLIVVGGALFLIGAQRLRGHFAQES
ncbi:MAG: ABC transporter permease [Candidatus Krumholzibacteriota bacterium]|nr:ABC transporter permease [Candidatus Krumholzibacteriota bacterium]